MARQTQIPPQHLTVPADRRFLGRVGTYVRELSGAAGLSEEESRRLELAAGEAFMNAVGHACPGSRPAGILVQGEIGPTELVLTIRDEGMSFGLPQENTPDRGGAERDIPSHGPEFRLIRNAVDEARFENLGARGRALRLVKRLSRALEIEPEPVVRGTETALPQQYDIRPMRPEDAARIPGLFWRAYGCSYKNADFYRPEGLLHLAASGRVISYVAVSGNGEVAGHAGLLPYGQLPMAEMAMLVVDPAHRGRGLMGALHKALEEKAVEMRLRGVCFDAITSHPISQWDVVRFGGKICDLELSAGSPHIFRTLVENEDRPQRESCLHCFKYLSPPSEALVHVPPHHRKMVLRIYENLEQPCRLGDAPAPRRAGAYCVHFDGAMQKGVIKVVSAGESLWPEISGTTGDLLECAGTEAVYLDLPLAQPASVVLCERAEREGYFFSGLRPLEASDGDNLRLQRLASPLDTTRLRIGPEFGKELCSYVAARMTKAE